MQTVVETGALALQHHKRGELDEAQQLYRKILRVDPGNADALHLLGVVAHQRKNHNEAIDLIRRAIELNSRNAAYHVNLATAHRALGQLDETLACYRTALALDATSPETHNNLGNALKDLGHRQEAMQSYLAALRLAPHFQPAFVNLGNCLQEMGCLEDSIQCYRKALELNGQDAQLWFNLANAVRCLGRLDDAIRYYQKSLQLRPDYAEAHLNLGSTLKVLWRVNEAIASYQRAIHLDPGNVMAYSNLGTALKDQGRFDEAAACFRTARKLQPDQPLWDLKLAALCPTVFSSNQEIDDYRQRLLDTVNDLATRNLQGEPAELVSSDCQPPFNLQFHGCDDRPLREAYARIFRKCFAQRDALPGHGRPRVGIVVTQYAENIFVRSMRGVLERINPGLFEIIVLCANTGLQTVRAGLTAAPVQVVAMPDSFDRTVQMLSDAQCHVLYFWEVGTSTLSYFLPFYRLAPVQCTSWGIQVTSGVPHMDYYLSSALVEPDDAETHYSERLLRATTLLTYQFRSQLPPRPKPREAFGLSADQHVYLCAQQLGKFHPDFDPVLAEILRRDEQGVVGITNDRHGFVAKQLTQRFAAHMPDVAERIKIIPEQKNPDYLSLVAAADVLLDPLHFGGVNTTYDGFSFGKPIVTLPSAFHRGRYTFGCYRKMGIADCVASTPDEYVTIAVSLGTDCEHRCAVSAKIREASTALFEDTAAVSEHERLLQQLVDQARLSHTFHGHE